MIPLSDDSGGCVVFLILAAVVVALVLSQNGQTLEKARRAYRDALQRLKADPTNPDLREQTLQLGRYYSNLTRNRRGVGLFDEVALMNDINAACAAASLSRQVPPPPAQSVESRLNHLLQLKSKNLIDETEYAERRREILREV